MVVQVVTRAEETAEGGGEEEEGDEETRRSEDEEQTEESQSFQGSPSLTHKPHSTHVYTFVMGPDKPAIPRQPLFQTY